MVKATTIESVRDIIKQWRNQGNRIAFVPTMGNLHAGHIKLVTEAKKQADKVVVSVFVNPTQFGEGEDFESYPRTEIEDSKKLKAVATDLLFLPSAEEMYQQNALTTVVVSGLSTLHCGASRENHFEGVATIVTKLFNTIQPDVAFFGEKDFQQLLIIRTVVKDLNFPVQIIGVATQREADGLALSSRNNYLSKQDREIAPKLYQSLCDAKKSILSTTQNMRDIERNQRTHLNELGFKVDYFSICRGDDLQQANEGDVEIVILVAAQLGKPRLIDNLSFSR